MKKFFGFLHGMPRKLRDYWRNRFASNENKVSRGASNISKIISYARGENWRRKEPKK